MMPKRIKCMLAVYDAWEAHDPSLITAASRAARRLEAIRLAKAAFVAAFPDWKPPPTPVEVESMRAAHKRKNTQRMQERRAFKALKNKARAGSAADAKREAGGAPAKLKTEL